MCIEELWLLGLIGNKKESRKSWEYYDIKNQRGFCQVKIHKGCERYSKWNIRWPHARNEADIRVRKGIQQYGTSWVNQWNIREKGGDKLRSYPKAFELYFPVFHQLSTRNHQKMLSSAANDRNKYSMEPLLDSLEYQKQSTTTQW